MLYGSAPPRRAGMDRDESTVMNCDIHVEIYQTVDADADRDGPGSTLTGAARSWCGIKKRV